MSKSLVPERNARKRAVTEEPKLARGTRDFSPAAIKVARGTRDLSPLVPLDPEDDTIVIDTDPNLPDELVLEAYTEDAPDVGDGGEASEVTEAQAAEIAAVIDARMIELAKRRFGISLSNGYMLTTRVLAGGNIQLHKPNRSTTPPSTFTECNSIAPDPGP